MNILPYIVALSDEGASPKYVHEVDSSLMYLGYCTPDCTSQSDKKWLIKRVQTVDGIQTIFTANGSRAYNQAWTDRQSLAYKPTETWAE